MPATVRVGVAHTSDLVYSRGRGLNFALVRLIPNNNVQFSEWMNYYNGEFLQPIYTDAQPQSVLLRTRVCVTVDDLGIIRPEDHTFCGRVVDVQAT